MGSVHGEELPYLFGAPLVEGFNHFPRNYTKSELSLAEAFMLYICNFAKTGNPNDHQRQESVLPISRERNRYRSINWEEYDTLHQKYLEFGMKPRVKNHFRAHQLSVWLRLIPEIHRAGMKDVIAKHNLFRNHNDPNLYDGPVRADPLTRVNYYDPTLELFRRPMPNVTMDIPQTTMDTMVTTCVNVISVRPGSTYLQGHSHNVTGHNLSNLEAAGYTAYSTALSVTIAIGCSLLILNVLIFAGVYYQRDKTRLQVKSLQHQQKRTHNNSSFDPLTSKHSHYLVGHSQSSNAIVEIDHQDKSSMMISPNIQQNDPHFTNIGSHRQNICHGNVTIQKSSPPISKHGNQGAHCLTLPRKINYNHQPRNQCNVSNCMTLPKNATFMNHNIPDIQSQAMGGLPPNGSIPMHKSTPPLLRSMTPPSSGHHYGGTPNVKNPCSQMTNSRMPQAAISEMNV